MTDSIKVLSFDPGVGYMGWACSTYDYTTRVPHFREYGCWKGDMQYRKMKELHGKFSKSFLILDAIYFSSYELMKRLNPDYIVTEGSYIHKFPQAFASLTLCIHQVRRAAKDAVGFDIYEVAPGVTKKVVLGRENKMTSDKLLIKNSILRMHNEGEIIITPGNQPIDMLTDHEYDAIGHNLAFIRTVLPCISKK